MNEHLVLVADMAGAMVKFVRESDKVFDHHSLPSYPR